MKAKTLAIPFPLGSTVYTVNDSIFMRCGSYLSCDKPSPPKVQRVKVSMLDIYLRKGEKPTFRYNGMLEGYIFTSRAAAQADADKRYKAHLAAMLKWAVKHEKATPRRLRDEQDLATVNVQNIRAAIAKA